MLAGVFSDYEEAVQKMVRRETVVRPNASTSGQYDFYYALYLETYHALGPLMHRVALHQGKHEQEGEDIR